MKNRFIRIISILCAAMLMAGAVSVWAAAEAPATPSDLAPEVKEETPEEPEKEQSAEPAEEQPAEPETETPEETSEELSEGTSGEEPEALPEDSQEEQPEELSVDVQEENPEGTPDGKPEKAQEAPADSEEVIITKLIRIGESWKGRMSKKKPAVLKLDISRSQSVHILIEGKNVWVTMEKSDRITGNPPRIETDSETGEAILNRMVEAGSYLIILGPVDPNPLAQAKVTIMDDEAFEAWETEQVKGEPEEAPEGEHEEAPEGEPEEAPEGAPEEVPEGEPEEVPEGEPEEVPEGEPEEEPEEVPEEEPEEVPEEEPEEVPEEEPEEVPEEDQEGNIPESESDRSITIKISWDSDNPKIGDTGHLTSVLEGYEGLTYSLQWQTSRDRQTWKDYTGATSPQLDVTLTRELNGSYFRLVVYVECEQDV